MLRSIAFIGFLVVLTAGAKTDNLLRTWKINVDKSCVEEKIGLTTYENIGHCTELRLVHGQSFEKFLILFCHSPICSNITLHELDPCLTDTQKDYLRNLAASAFARRNYGCENDAKVYWEMINAVNESVCSSAGADMSHCYANISLLQNVTMEEFFTEVPCRIDFNFKNCLMQSYNECEDKTLYNAYWKFECIGVNATSCKNYIHECNSVDSDEMSDKLPDLVAKKIKVVR